jgi:hypothetical protein
MTTITQVGSLDGLAAGVWMGEVTAGSSMDQ